MVLALVLTKVACNFKMGLSTVSLRKNHSYKIPLYTSGMQPHPKPIRLVLPQAAEAALYCCCCCSYQHSIWIEQWCNMQIYQIKSSWYSTIQFHICWNWLGKVCIGIDWERPVLALIGKGLYWHWLGKVCIGIDWERSVLALIGKGLYWHWLGKVCIGIDWERSADADLHAQTNWYDERSCLNKSA